MNEFIPYSFGMIDKEKLVELREQGKTLRECAEEFGVCFQAIAKALARIREGSRPIGRPRKAPAPAPSEGPKRPRGRPKKSVENLKTRLPGDEYAESGISKPSIHAGLRKKAGRPKLEDREEVRVRVLSETAEKIRQRGSKWFREFLENEIK